MRRSLIFAPIALAVALVATLVSGLFNASPVAQLATVSHAPRMTLQRASRFDSTSSNWSGYAVTGATFSDVKGSWVVPTATCTGKATAYSSFWVGIDGDGTNSVEQLGTDSDCAKGKPSYYAWWEMYPNPSRSLSTRKYKVEPGDTLTAEVTTPGAGIFALTETSSRGWTFTTMQFSLTAQRGSAEWIAEAPSSNTGLLPLANFGTVTFSSCTADGVSISANPNPDQITMATKNGPVKAQPSGLGGSGDSFTVTWQSS